MTKNIKNISDSIKAKLLKLASKYSFEGRILQQAIMETFERRNTLIDRHHVLFTENFSIKSLFCGVLRFQSGGETSLKYRMF
ncbi:hypothetical protein RBH29_17280 [Herbivorax sp. ANBcel31]|uniref:hypothetical protein n=1 Tax=Herbivorax sp. ANBcel31 TaxID=3069754 RepID=UPI0027AF8159|nr:hypothetical protein [Herbivorax sp. ANBcel31]MDQ2088178.1 hypothetical protein [Herbivorax sp. ANBcel31]